LIKTNALPLIERQHRCDSNSSSTGSCCCCIVVKHRAVSTDHRAVYCVAVGSVRLRQELVDGLRVMFDFTLPLILLYDSERSQYQRLTRPAPIKLYLSRH